VAASAYISALSLHDALPIWRIPGHSGRVHGAYRNSGSELSLFKVSQPIGLIVGSGVFVPVRAPTAVSIPGAHPGQRADRIVNSRCSSRSAADFGTAHGLDAYRCYFRPGGVQLATIAWGLCLPG